MAGSCVDGLGQTVVLVEVAILIFFIFACEVKPVCVKKDTCLVFDFDGTLADTLELVLNLYNKVAPAYGCQPAGEEIRERILVEPYSALLKEYGISNLKLAALMLRIRTDMGKLLAEVKVVEGIKEALLKLKQQGFTMGVLTSNSRKNVCAFMAHNGMTEVFDFIYSGKNLFGKDKVMHQMLAKEGLTKEKVLYVGDELRDIEASKKVGLRVIAVTWGLYGKEALAALNPEAVVETPEELVSGVYALTGRV